MELLNYFEPGVVELLLVAVVCSFFGGLLRCLHCKDETPIDKATKRGKLWSCDQCNKARRAVVAEYAKRGQKHVWGKMSKDAKDQEIRKNKGKAPGRGKKFPVEIVESVGGSDLTRPDPCSVVICSWLSSRL